MVRSHGETEKQKQKVQTFKSAYLYISCFRLLVVHSSPQLLRKKEGKWKQKDTGRAAKAKMKDSFFSPVLGKGSCPPIFPELFRYWRLLHGTWVYLSYCGCLVIILNKENFLVLHVKFINIFFLTNKFKQINIWPGFGVKRQGKGTLTYLNHVWYRSCAIVSLDLE